jgi:hypothetical protein
VTIETQTGYFLISIIYSGQSLVSKNSLTLAKFNVPFQWQGPQTHKGTVRFVKKILRPDPSHSIEHPKKLLNPKFQQLWSGRLGATTV